MSRTNYKELVIFSAFRGNKSHEQNEKNHRAAMLGLEVDKIPFTEVIGMYKGESEKSLMVLTSGDFAFKTCFEIAKIFDQESVLTRDNENNARLVYLDNSRPPERLGKLIKVSESEAILSDSYTYVPSLNEYYTTKEF